MSTVYRHYDQVALDREYNNRTKVADARDWLTRYRRWSDSVIAPRKRRQLAYGPRSYDNLDIYPAPEARAPIHVFFHGGYWKSLAAADFGFVCRAAPNALTVVVDYPLLPGATMEKLLQHCRQALVLVCQQAPEWGGDPERLVISGHSAGGHIVAALLTSLWPELSKPPVISAAIALSGLYDLEPIRCSFLNDELALSEADVVTHSPLNYPPTSRAPLSIVVGGDEGPEYLRHSRRLADHWRQHRLSPELWELPDCHHFAIVGQFNDPSSPLSQRLQRQLGTETYLPCC